MTRCIKMPLSPVKLKIFMDLATSDDINYTEHFRELAVPPEPPEEVTEECRHPNPIPGDKITPYPPKQYVMYTTRPAVVSRRSATNFNLCLNSPAYTPCRCRLQGCDPANKCPPKIDKILSQLSTSLPAKPRAPAAYYYHTRW
jgi:hypothetical protein